MAVENCWRALSLSSLFLYENVMFAFGRLVLFEVRLPTIWNLPFEGSTFLKLRKTREGVGPLVAGGGIEGSTEGEPTSDGKTTLFYDEKGKIAAVETTTIL